MVVRRWLLPLAMMILAVCALWWISYQLPLLESLIEQESDLRNWYRQSPWLAGISIFFAYTLLLALPLPVSLPATLFCGWIFGFSIGLTLASFASTLAASITFCFSRHCLSGLISSPFATVMTRWRNLSLRNAVSLLFLLRLTPGVPFFVINAGFGLTAIRLEQFWIVSQLGMLPATVIHIYLGSRLPSLKQLADHGMGSLMSWDLMICLVLAGSLPFLMRFLARRIWRRKEGSVGQSQKR